MVNCQGQMVAVEEAAGKTYRLWPHKLHGEGHFVAVLMKLGELSPVNEGTAKKEKTEKNALDKNGQAALAEFLSCVSKELADWILAGKLVLFGDQLYRLPDGAPGLSGLRVLRAGLHIGEYKKNRLEPSHALALCMGTGDAKTYVNLTVDDRRARSFFRGESFFTEEGEIQGSGKGWGLVCIDGCSAGWGKFAGGQVKNHYPKGLRREL